MRACTQLCPNLCDPMDCSPGGSLIHGILQTRILQWVALSYTRGSYQPRDWTDVSCITSRFFFLLLSHRGSPRQINRIKFKACVSEVLGSQKSSFEFFGNIAWKPGGTFLPIQCFFGEGNGNPLQSSCLENPMDRGAWGTTIHGTRLGQFKDSDMTEPLNYHHHHYQRFLGHSVDLATHRWNLSLDSAIILWQNNLFKNHFPQYGLFLIGFVYPKDAPSFHFSMCQQFLSKHFTWYFILLRLCWNKDGEGPAN